ncbi:putative F-box/FBD/LRR-repeat protein at5g22670 [Phtheirospermum japonicum]|uniref:Putative F-box/FBD/LRR-repeat protein at5g22670 n=1 Tax=Phtheirospermum japonicum TaxID=374723 RepID=A0A830DJH1_9LAMI|nr:putative F-box/FBD/LRR-repeat protein at5g22670 [Phtheirospermum japonicum]
MLSIDRLSALPDDVICHILSFLSTKISVQTSILARRWKFLWAHVPNLDLDSKYHHSMMSFSSTINKVMMLRKEQSINTFNISCEDFDCDENELEKWITSAIQCNVQNLYLDLDFDLLGRLPQCLFTSKTLVDLSLYCCCVGIPSVGDVSLPSLKYLLLCSIDYDSDEALPRLLSGCPVLEELIVERIVGRDLDCCYISSPTIKRLSISFPLDNSGHGRVKINAPRLGYLGVYDCLYDQISLSPMPSLIEARIHFNIYALGVDYYVYNRGVLKFIDSLCKVKCLKLLGTSEEFLDLGLAGSYVRFGNLIRLELTADWRFIPKFLQSADNLEVLVINKVAKELQNWMEPIRKQCACLLSSLKTITIDEFGCTEQELNMVRYLLRSAQVLKRMEIYCLRDGISSEAKSDALQSIFLFHRGSKECVVAFS